MSSKLIRLPSKPIVLKEVKKYKVVLSPSVKNTLARVNSKDKKMLLNAIDNIAKNPTAGTPWKPKTIVPWPNEKFCRYCGTPVLMLMDPKDNEVSFYCESPTCDKSWMTKDELIKGRTGFLKHIKKTPRAVDYKGLDPKKIKFIKEIK